MKMITLTSECCMSTSCSLRNRFCWKCIYWKNTGRLTELRGGLENQRLSTDADNALREVAELLPLCQVPTAAACPATSTGAGRWVSCLCLLPSSLTTAQKNYPESQLLCVTSSQCRVHYSFICLAKRTVCAHVLGKQAPGIFSLWSGRRPCLSPRPKGN